MDLEQCARLHLLYSVGEVFFEVKANRLQREGTDSLCPDHYRFRDDTISRGLDADMSLREGNGLLDKGPDIQDRDLLTGIV